ncbi:MAG: lysostaphin resistance A-like protein [Anaerolineales bacterium]
MKSWGRERSALLELAVLFLPAVPALIWLWPNLRDEHLQTAVQSAAYVYVLAGVLWIGRRRWSWEELGITHRGFWLGAVFGGVLFLLRILALLGFRLPVAFKPLQALPFLWDIVFYFGFVALTEELLFRGLLFRALEDGWGPAAAVIGSAAGFALWHIGWAGPLVIGHFVLGLYFGLIRRRSQGILGLIAAHGLYDLFAEQLAEPIPLDGILQAIARGEVAAAWLLLGDGLLVGAVIFLIWVYPRVRARGKPDGARERRA